MRGLAGIAVAAAALAAAGSAPAAHRFQPPLPAQKAALAALQHAVASGQVDRATAARDRAEINRAARLIRGLPSSRAGHVAVALDQVAAFSGRLTKPRAVALFGQLKANDDYFARHWAPAGKTDITDADGVVYRYFAGQCFEFHPLAEFAELNARVSAGDEDGAARLASALIARGVYQPGGGVGWEYYFAFGGGHAPWLSGMAQAVAAQAFARAAALLPDDETMLLQAGRGAYRAIPGRLLSNVGVGPWIRLYAFDSTPVLNAQLQSVFSLRAYGTKAGDEAAAGLAARMQDAAAAMLPRFDTGYWTYYALPHDLSTLHYQDYVVRLLKLLSPLDPRFADAAGRFASYRKQPPAFKLEEGGLGELRFWLSKPALVSAYSPAGGSRSATFADGWHALSWGEPRRAGVYPVAVNAIDWAGNRTSFEALPIVRVGGGARTQAMRVTAASTPSRPPLSIGAGLDFPAQAARAPRLGLRLVRVAVAWPFGASTPDLALAAAFQPLAGVDVLVELQANTLPADTAARAALAQYASTLAQEIPGIHELLLTPAPTTITAADYAAALAAVRDAVHAELPDVAVGPLIDGASTPKATVAALGRALAPPDVVALRPAATGATGAWTEANVPQLVSAFAQSFGADAPPVVIDGLALPTTIPANELAAYPPGQQPAAGAVPATSQGKTYAEVIARAACSSTVTGIVIDRLVDSATVPAPPTGLFYAAGSAKASAALVAAAAGPAQRGTVVCPGLASRAAASALELPEQLDPSAPASVVLGCIRDCLYLVTLHDPQGRPVSARRGDLRGRAAPLTLELPKARLDASQYRFDVRLVDRVNPGPVTQLTSRLVPVSRP